MNLTTTRHQGHLALLGALALLLALLPLGGTAEAQEAKDALNLSADSPAASSIAWSKVVYTPLGAEGPSSPPTSALIGRDDLFADNLAAGSLSGTVVANGRPLFLTDGLVLDADVLEEMDRVLPDGATVTILGGEEAITPAVEAELEGAGYMTERLAGTTRVETAVEIAQTLDADTVLIVRAFPSLTTVDQTQAFADSLGASALAAANGWEILFTQTDVLTGSTRTELEAAGYADAVIVGGTAAISEEVMADVAELVSGETTRVSGDTRFETAVNLNALRSGELGDVVITVDGQAVDAWADGFPAANQAGLANYPVVLTNRGMIPAETEAYLQSFTGGTRFAAHFTDVVLLCGTTVTADTCEAALEDLNGSADGVVKPFPPAAAAGLTGGPELLGVQVESPEAGAAEVRFTFDEDVTGKTPVAECFHLYPVEGAAFSGGDDASNCDGTDDASGGHADDTNVNPGSLDGDTAVADPADPNSVIVTFPIATEEIAGIALATVDWDAVRDTDDIENLEGAIGLVGGGDTDGPDLIDAEIDGTSVLYVFDEAFETPTGEGGGEDGGTTGTPLDVILDPLAEAIGGGEDPEIPGAIAGRFFIYDAAGAPTRGATAAVTGDGTVIRVTFAAGSVENAVAATVNDLAGVDADGTSNPESAPLPLS